MGRISINWRMTLATMALFLTAWIGVTTLFPAPFTAQVMFYVGLTLSLFPGLRAVQRGVSG